MVILNQERTNEEGDLSMTCLLSFSNSCILHFILWAEDVVLANKMYFAEYVITLFRLQAFFSYMYWILIYST